MQKDNIDLICDISELAGLFEKSHSLDEFLQTVVSTIAYHMRAAVCSIYLYDEERKELVLTANQGLDQQLVGTLRLSIGEGLTGLALKELRPICVGDGPRHPNYKHVPGLAEEEFRAFLGVPILRGLNRIAVLVVQDPQPDYFDENDVKALKAITTQLAKTIEDAKLLIDLHGLGQTAPAPEPEEEEFPSFFKGISGSDAIGIGTATVITNDSYDVIMAMDEEDHHCGIEDFERSIRETEEQLTELQRQTEEELADVASLIFSAHLLIVMDPSFTGAMRERIDQGIAPPRAVANVVNEYIHLFSKSPNPRLREKVQDLKDLGHRILFNLTNMNEDTNADYTGQIVIAEELLPSDFLKLATQNAAGIIITHGSTTSHISILASSLDMPLTYVDHPKMLEVPEGTPLIMDAGEGNIFIDPGQKIRSNYVEILDTQKSWDEQAESILPETLTRDKTRIHLYCNINLLSDLKVARKFKAEGIGLYRSEFPFIVRPDFPSEEEQYVIYRRLVEGMAAREVIFRTLDIGGDKVLPYASDEHEHETNPFLGMRGIRFSLRNERIFCQQIRAMLRATHDRECQIMFPMVSSVDDFKQARRHIYACVDQLKAEGMPHNDYPSLGVMIEVPAAVEIVNELAQETDFLSIGTNDLIQYLLAVDRTNERVSDFYISYHPAVLRAMRKVADAALHNEVDLSICGNMASDDKMIPFLLGIGIKKLSVDPRSIGRVQQTISKLHIEDAHLAAQKMLSLGEISEIRDFLERSS